MLHVSSFSSKESFINDNLKTKNAYAFILPLACFSYISEVKRSKRTECYNFPPM